ncbi:ribosome recycling factor [Patescibacteria group bacterium]|nr:ribosome recycling factor [Candidatus Falkowbacteria bacterium]MBU3905516.1 ribosome recycling factor [Patescibacteria group bacterium]MCG2698479.1 ribosome recycling factor [Candidatus Parcubacteria bacterium]MBU4014830.1 ribosome recycling factor [Patescibacteria group bacterium]MBU4026623.1 ribosome recycling factor [Patescibacteria group bacterium]
MNQYTQSKQEEFNKAIDFFKKDIASLRTGRANPAMLDGVQVEAYGSKTPLNGLAGITVPEARSIVVAPWDKNVIKDIEKAIINFNLGVSVVNEGDKLRITVPQLTEESRRELVKRLNEKMEAARISIRQTRDEIKENIEQAEKNKEINEDDKFRFIKEMDEEVGRQNDEVKKIREGKEKEIMTI